MIDFSKLVYKYLDREVRVDSQVGVMFIVQCENVVYDTKDATTIADQIRKDIIKVPNGTLEKLYELVCYHYAVLLYVYSAELAHFIVNEVCEYSSEKDRAKDIAHINRVFSFNLVNPEKKPVYNYEFESGIYEANHENEALYTKFLIRVPDNNRPDEQIICSDMELLGIDTNLYSSLYEINRIAIFNKLSAITLINANTSFSDSERKTQIERIDKFFGLMESKNGKVDDNSNKLNCNYKICSMDFMSSGHRYVSFDITPNHGCDSDSGLKLFRKDMELLGINEDEWGNIITSDDANIAFFNIAFFTKDAVNKILTATKYKDSDKYLSDVIKFFATAYLKF